MKGARDVAPKACGGRKPLVRAGLRDGTHRDGGADRHCVARDAAGAGLMVRVLFSGRTGVVGAVPLGRPQRLL